MCGLERSACVIGRIQMLSCAPGCYGLIGFVTSL
eukprot:SAG22_NODE_7086_length_778_cov_1.341679_2_plen_33_part_01